MRTFVPIRKALSLMLLTTVGLWAQSALAACRVMTRMSHCPMSAGTISGAHGCCPEQAAPAMHCGQPSNCCAENDSPATPRLAISSGNKTAPRSPVAALLSSSVSGAPVVHTATIEFVHLPAFVKPVTEKKTDLRI